MTRRILLEELTREEARTAAPHTLVVLPVGAIEQHGPHLPVGTDSLTIEYLARTAAAEAAAAEAAAGSTVAEGAGAGGAPPLL